MADTVKCPVCGADIEQGSKFCEFCGSNLQQQQQPKKPESERTEEYKCPACGSALVFNTESGKLKCSSCDNEYEIGTIKQYQNNRTEAEFQWDRKYTNALNETLPEMTSYICQSCGAEIITDGTTAATHCPYCDNEVIITEKLTGALKPNGVIPFKIDKKGIKEKIKEFCKGKKLLPDNFFTDQKIDAIQGVYVPVWLFDGKLDGSVSLDGTTTSSYTTGNYRYTETSHYLINCDGSMEFTRVPVDGSEKMPDDLMNSIEPFDYSQIVPFDGQYLSGFLADRYDKDPEASIPTASQRMMNSAVSAFRSAVSQYSSVSLRNNGLNLYDPSVKYVLLPVYVFNCDYKGQKYRFAMNGQTGKLVGELPIDKGKKARAFWIPFLIAAAIVFLILWLLTM
ncbi:MAG: zinc ribbon domain-containing protein [Clostridia bacterium]|nr:zinc ribbon domain-containing protein [Clostridia bacterium]